MLCKLLYYLKYNKHIRADSVSKRGTTLPGLSELVCCVQAGVGAARQGCPLSRASKCRLCSQVCACICALFASQQKTGAVDVFFFPYNHAKNVKMLVSNCATQFVGCQICILVWFYITGCWRFPHTCSLPLRILQRSWLQWQRVPLAASAWLDLK